MPAFLKMWMDGWTGFRPLFCTIKAELGRGQPGLMRWSWDEALPQSSIDRSTLDSAAHRATSELAAAPLKCGTTTPSLSENIFWIIKEKTVGVMLGSHPPAWPQTSTIE